MKNKILWFCRILVGVLFIFSGLVKANDPVGFGIKLDEYYEVFASTWSWTGFLFKASWLVGTTTLQAAFLTTLEVVLGIALLLGIMKNLVSWLLLLMILFFTWLTGFTAVTGNPSECGCFGDAIPLTALQSFYKDLVLTILILTIFFLRKNIKPAFSPAVNFIVFILVGGFALWVNIHVLRHDVFIDFRPYAIGKNIQEQMTIPADAPKAVIRMNYIYESKSSGERETISIMSDKADYTVLQKYADTATWKFIERKDKVIKKGFEAKTADFNISDISGANLTNRILNNPDMILMVVIQNFDATSDEGWLAIKQLQSDAEKEGIFTFALAGEGTARIDEFRHLHQAAFPFYPGDSKVCLTIARINPTVVLLRRGTVIDKWGWRDLPSFTDLKAAYFPDRKPTQLLEMTDELFALNEDAGAMMRSGEGAYGEFYLEDTTGNDVSRTVFSDSDAQYMLIINETNSTVLPKEKWMPIDKMMHTMDSLGLHYFVVSSSSADVLKAMQKFSGLNFTYYLCDKAVLRNIMKENAGLVVVKNGIVVQKFTERNWPPANSITYK